LRLPPPRFIIVGRSFETCPISIKQNLGAHRQYLAQIFEPDRDRLLMC